MLLQDLGIEVFRIRREHQTRPATADRGDLLASLLDVERVARSNAFDPVVPVVAGLQAEMLLAAGRPGSAVDKAEDGFAALRTPRDREQAVALFVAYAEALAALGRWSEVLATCREAIGFVELRRRRVSPLSLASAYLAFRVRLYELGAHAALREEGAGPAIALAELVKARSVTNLRAAEAMQPTDAEALQSEFRSLGRQLDAGGLAGEDAEAVRARRAALWDLITIGNVRGRRMESDLFAIDAVRARLARDEALVYYFWVGPTELLIAVVGRDSTEARVETLTAPQREQVTTLGRAVMTFGEASIAQSVAPGASLSACLLPAWVRTLLQDKTRLLVSPHRALHSVPFHALPVDSGFLIQRWAVTYVPNATSLLGSVPAAPQPRALLVAAPSHEGPAAGRLRYLSDAAAEIDDVAALYRQAGTPVRTLVQDEATEASLHDLHERGELQTFTVLHFACHGENVDEDLPMESRLYLRDAALDGLDIANWTLRADLLVLSACASGQRPIGGRDFKELPGDDLFGLQAAFFIAGVRQMVSALWPVESWAARRICVDFHAALQTMPAEVALQQAQTRFIARGPRSAAPAVWAPFFLVRAAGRRAAA
jgi:CHAT domain-containing protein